jgi:hypothetical protein
MMLNSPLSLLLLATLGVFTGIVAGVLGIGGGLLIVPVLSLMGVSLVQATATSLVGVLLSAVSGSIQNWRKGTLNLRAAGSIALFGLPTAQVGAWLGDRLQEHWLAFSFALLMLLTIYFMNLKHRLKLRECSADETAGIYRLMPVAQIGLLAGLLSGLFGIGGGVVMVSLQMLMLGESIKSAVRTSLGAIVLIAISGLLQHSFNSNVLWLPGICLGIGGIIGAQLGTRLLPRMSDRLVSRLFQSLLVLLAAYMAWKGFNALQ